MLIRVGHDALYILNPSRQNGPPKKKYPIEIFFIFQHRRLAQFKWSLKNY